MRQFNSSSAYVYTFEPWRMGIAPSSGSLLLVDAQSNLKLLYTKEGAFVQNKHGFFRLFPEVDKPAQKLKPEVRLELPEGTNPTPLLLGINLTTSCGVKYWTTGRARVIRISRVVLKKGRVFRSRLIYVGFPAFVTFYRSRDMVCLARHALNIFCRQPKKKRKMNRQEYQRLYQRSYYAQKKREREEKEQEEQQRQEEAQEKLERRRAQQAASKRRRRAASSASLCLSLPSTSPSPSPLPSKEQCQLQKEKRWKQRAKSQRRQRAQQQQEKEEQEAKTRRKRQLQKERTQRHRNKCRKEEEEKKAQQKEAAESLSSLLTPTSSLTIPSFALPALLRHSPAGSLSIPACMVPSFLSHLPTTFLSTSSLTSLTTSSPTSSSPTSSSLTSSSLTSSSPTSSLPTSSSLTSSSPTSSSPTSSSSPSSSPSSSSRPTPKIKLTVLKKKRDAYRDKHQKSLAPVFEEDTHTKQKKQKTAPDLSVAKVSTVEEVSKLKGKALEAQLTLFGLFKTYKGDSTAEGQKKRLAEFVSNQSAFQHYLRPHKPRATAPHCSSPLPSAPFSAVVVARSRSSAV